MNSLAYSFICLCKKYPEGSYATRHDRRSILKRVSFELQELRYRQLTVLTLRKEHVLALLKSWDKRGLAAGTIKNRLACLRWALRKVGRTKVLPPSNRELNVPDRVYVTNTDKSVDPSFIQNIQNPFCQIAAVLCSLFGLRSEEAMKLQPHKADKGDYLELTKTKNNRPRKVPIDSQRQRDALDQAKILAKDTPERSLIPCEKYSTQKRRFQYCMRKHGKRAHGLRHGYAMRIYTWLTGLEPPAKGGPSRRNLRGEARIRDKMAQREIMRRLGHGDSRSMSQYVGY